MKTYKACNVQDYGEYGFDPMEVYTIKAENRIEAHHWIINHLDSSIKWQIIGPCVY